MINHILIAFGLISRSTSSLILHHERTVNSATWVHKRCRRQNVSFSSRRLSMLQMTASSFESTTIQYLEGKDVQSNNSCRIAYRYFQPPNLSINSTPDIIVVFLNGLLSNMSGTKSKALQQYAVNEKGVGYLCFDYRGHGDSSGNFIECTMHDWMEDTRMMLDHVLSLSTSCLTTADLDEFVQDDAASLSEQASGKPKVILVGSSMGAWIALNLAMERQYRDVISGVIGIGSAIDFTHTTFQSLSGEDKRILDKEKSSVQIYSPYLEEPYPFTRALYESGKEYVLIHGNGLARGASGQELKLHCPVRLLHGSRDDVIHCSTVSNAAKALASQYQGEDITVKILDGGDHRLSQAKELAEILNTLDELMSA